MRTRLPLSELAEAFDLLLDLEPLAREKWFAQTSLEAADRDKLERMLQADADAEAGPLFLDASASQHAVMLDPGEDRDVEPGDLVGKQFGSFRLTALLGQGGMATVFLGERIGADFDQQVAVKVLRRGLYSAVEQQLFRRERQLLAQLDHPNIARLIDGGVTEAGIPYLVMEYVDGLRLDQHVRAKALGVRERLRLFIDVCGAVQAAHQALIVHRDIKPSNILVTDSGSPKLLDFGIAKLLADDDGGASRTLTAALTPGYAAPEQMKGESVTTAADVYALGVVLHEIITGKRPLHGDAALASSAVRVVGGDGPDPNPAMATALRRALRGDLDNIIMRALSTEPQQRYASVAALVEDVENHLDGRPVKAHPRSRWYVVQKFVQRHRAATAITATLSIALIVAFGAAIWQAHSARLEAQRANAVRDFVVSIFRTAEAERPRDERPTAEDVVTAGARQALADPTLPDGTRAAMLAVLSQVASSLGAPEAMQTTQALMALSDALYQPGDREWIEARVLRAQVLVDHADFAAAVALLEPLRGRLIERADALALDALVTLDEASHKRGGPAETGLVQRRAEVRRLALSLFESSPQQALAALIAEVDGLAAVHQFSDALALGEDVIARWERMGKPAYTETLWLYGSIGNAASSLGDIARGEQAYRDAIALADRLYTGAHANKAWFVGLLGSFLVSQGRLDEAEPYVLKGLQMRRDTLGDTDPQTIFAFNAAARLRSVQERDDEAMAFANEAVSNCEKAALQQPACATALYTRGRLRSGAGDFVLAEQDIRASIAMQQALTGADSAMVAPPLAVLAELQRRMGNHAEAIKTADHALSLWSEAGGGYWSQVAQAKFQRAWARLELGQAQAALDEIAPVEAEFSLKTPSNIKTRIGMLQVMARAQARVGQTDAARRTAAAAIALTVDTPLAGDASLVLLQHIVATGRDD